MNVVWWKWQEEMDQRMNILKDTITMMPDEFVYLAWSFLACNAPDCSSLVSAAHHQTAVPGMPPHIDQLVSVSPGHDARSLISDVSLHICQHQSPIITNYQQLLILYRNKLIFKPVIRWVAGGQSLAHLIWRKNILFDFKINSCLQRTDSTLKRTMGSCRNPLIAHKIIIIIIIIIIVTITSPSCKRKDWRSLFPLISNKSQSPVSPVIIRRRPFNNLSSFSTEVTDKCSPVGSVQAELTQWLVCLCTLWQCWPSLVSQKTTWPSLPPLMKRWWLLPASLTVWTHITSPEWPDLIWVTWP